MENRTLSLSLYIHSLGDTDKFIKFFLLKIFLKNFFKNHKNFIFFDNSSFELTPVNS